jgi:hypothetical protein
MKVRLQAEIFKLSGDAAFFLTIGPETEQRAPFSRKENGSRWNCPRAKYQEKCSNNLGLTLTTIEAVMTS